MYIYDFYNFDYDDSMSFKLEHDKHFTKEEFEEIVNKAIITIKNNKKKAKKKLDEYYKSKIRLSNKKIECLLNTSSEFLYLDNIKKELIKTYGFQDLKSVYIFAFNEGGYSKGIKEVNEVIE